MKVLTYFCLCILLLHQANCELHSNVPKVTQNETNFKIPKSNGDINFYQGNECQNFYPSTLIRGENNCRKLHDVNTLFMGQPGKSLQFIHTSATDNVSTLEWE
jgi:hypothetical protein